MDTFFAVATPGLEAFTASELTRQGLKPSLEPGGVVFKGGLADLYKANLHLRTASRVLARLGTFFRGETYPVLRQRLKNLPWERRLQAGTPLNLHVTCHASRLNHTEQVGTCVLQAVLARLGTASPLVAGGEEHTSSAQMVVVRIVHDRVTVSIDSSGELLHKRGYRLAVGKAPLRETLAAAMLAASGWDCSSPLLDPFCGSGTIAIEAALLALGLPPGRNRRFAFMSWPGFDEGLWQSVSSASQLCSAPPPLILASDRDAGVIRSAQENAERAGVAGLITFTCQAVSSIQPSSRPGWVVTNPPYGERIHTSHDLRDLFARFGDVLRQVCPGWHLTMLSSDRVLLGQMHLDLETSLGFLNGGIPVRLARGLVPAA